MCELCSMLTRLLTRFSLAGVISCSIYSVLSCKSVLY